MASLWMGELRPGQVRFPWLGQSFDPGPNSEALVLLLLSGNEWGSLQS